MKLSKIISLLLVPLLLFTLALPAYADGGSESYLIYFETGGGTGVPIIASTNLDGNLTSLPSHELDGDRITTNTEFTSDGTIYAHWRPIAKGSSSAASKPSPNTSTADEGFSFRAHAGTFLVAGTMFFTLVALYAR